MPIGDPSPPYTFRRGNHNIHWEDPGAFTPKVAFTSLLDCPNPFCWNRALLSPMGMWTQESNVCDLGLQQGDHATAVPVGGHQPAGRVGRLLFSHDFLLQRQCLCAWPCFPPSLCLLPQPMAPSSPPLSLATLGGGLGWCLSPASFALFVKAVHLPLLLSNCLLLAQNKQTSNLFDSPKALWRMVRPLWPFSHGFAAPSSG